MARLVPDEDFPGPVVELLCDLGHDVVTVQEAPAHGRARLLPSREALADATPDDRAMLTHNHRQTKRLHAKHPHAGIISWSRDKDDLPGLAQRIHDAVSAMPSRQNSSSESLVRIREGEAPAEPPSP